MSLDETAAFVKVVDCGGFAAAGRELRVPRSTLSRQVLRLEERIGVRLLQRTTRKLGLTEAGKHYYEQCRSAVESLALAERSVVERSERPSGTLRISSVNLATIDWMLDGMAEFSARYPEVELVFEFANRRVDLIEEGFDLAIRGGRSDDSTLVARRLVDTSLILCASPDYLARRGKPKTLAALRAHDGLLLGPRASPLWVEGPKGRADLRFGKQLWANDLAFLCGLAVRGRGIGLIENGLAADHLAAGRLQRVLPRHGVHTHAGLYVVYPSRLHVPAKVRAFVDFMVAHCEAHNPLQVA